ncbi:MAG: CooT family nickel-binding protein [Spirochaetales bacterium]|nr:CooT family nickel-binding protein [Spirochaetales bacterium]
MCMATAYLRQPSGDTVLLEEVAFVQREDGGVVLRPLFGEQKRVSAAISEIDFLNSTIVLERREGERE